MESGTLRDIAFPRPPNYQTFNSREIIRRYVVYSQRPKRVVHIELMGIDGNASERVQQALSCGVDLVSMVNVTPTRDDKRPFRLSFAMGYYKLDLASIHE